MLYLYKTFLKTLTPGYNGLSATTSSTKSETNLHAALAGPSALPRQFPTEHASTQMEESANNSQLKIS
jgi:hypothetical protein